MPGGADDRHLLRALELARRAWGDTHPNPMVGAVLEEDGRAVAEGWHARAGEAHAEVAALRALGRAPAPGAVLHVTLEPCSTQGRTPPCVAAILAAGIRRVVIGTLDPNPLHAGRGVDLLRAAGVEVRLAEGATELACRRLNLIFNHWITRRRPLVCLKAGRDASGRTTPLPGSRWITGETARADVMRWRRLFPVIAAGAGTVLADDPALTARLPEGTTCPLRLVIDPSGRLMGRERLAVLADAHRGRTRVALDAARAPRGYADWLAHLGVQAWVLPGEGFLSAALARAGAEGGPGILVEAGPGLGRALIAEGLVDHAIVYTAGEGQGDPCASPWLADPLPLLDPETAFFGSDARISGGWKRV